MKTLTTLEDLTADPHNANTGTLRGSQLLEHSISTYGAGRGIVVDAQGVVIAGNKTWEHAVEAGLPIKVVQTDGTTLVAVVRTDLDLGTDPKARVLAYLDNRTAEVGLAWDPAQLAADIAEGLDLGRLWTEDERRKLLATADVPQDGPPMLLMTTLTFDTAQQYEQWLALVQVISKTYAGITFAQQLDQWIGEQP
jgi:hypothetical protein